MWYDDDSWVISKKEEKVAMDNEQPGGTGGEPGLESHGEPAPGLEELRKRLRMDGVTNKAEKHRENEDAFFMDPEEGFCGVFDGVGGHKGGDEASSLASDYVQRVLAELPSDLSVEQVQAKVYEALEGANQGIFDNSEEREAMTTATVVVIWTDSEGKPVAIIGNVGDSRAYRLPKRGKLEQLTKDDNLLNGEFIDDGLNEEKKREIQHKLDSVASKEDYNELSEVEKSYYEKRNIITQALGQGNVEPTVTAVPLKPGNRLLVCTDGVHDNLTPEQIQQALRSNQKGNIVSRLMKKALGVIQSESFRAKDDDVTLVVIEIPDEDVGWGERFLRGLRGLDRGRGRGGGGDLVNRDSVEEGEQGGSLYQQVSSYVGQPVTVKRSDGAVEKKDWQIRSIMRGEQEVEVVKNAPIDGKLLRKRVPFSDFLDWQELQ